MGVRTLQNAAVELVVVLAHTGTRFGKRSVSIFKSLVTVGLIEGGISEQRFHGELGSAPWCTQGKGLGEGGSNGGLAPWDTGKAIFLMA